LNQSIQINRSVEIKITGFRDWGTRGPLWG
jgi:hypothetical protein